MNFRKNSRTGSIFRDHLTLGPGRILDIMGGTNPSKIPRVPSPGS